MFNFLIYIVNILMIFAVGYALSLNMAWGKNNRGQKIIFLVANFLGFAFGTGIYIAKRLQPKKLLQYLTALNRKVIVSTWLIALLALIVYLVYLFFVNFKKEETKISKISYFLSSALMSIMLIPFMAHLLPLMYLKTGEFVAFNEESISTGTLFRLGGYVLGCLLIVLLTLAIYKTLGRLTDSARKYFRLLLLAAISVDLTVRGISSAARLGIIPRTDFVFDTMIFEDKSTPYFATLYLFLTLLLAIFVYRLYHRVEGEFKTSAAKRKSIWWYRNCRRWAVSMFVFMFIGCILVTFISDYINRPVELAPAEQYMEQGDKIIVPLSSVEDGHLHRFAYVYQDHNIRFIVVRKPNSNAYGVGLDACDICGIAGYFERGDTVVCKRCDVVMNKATIGFRGGCNPVPFPYVVEDGQIIINKSDLEKEADRFPAGA